MKNLLAITMICSAMIFCFSTNAQSKGDFRGSAGLAMGSKTSIDTDTGKEKIGIGINVGVEYFLDNVLSLAPSYSYYFPVSEGGVDFNTTLLNFDARFYVGPSFYILAGYATLSSTFKSSGSNISSNKGGVNVGVGAMIPMGDAKYLNIQAKYNSILDQDIEWNQIMAQAGIAFSF